MPLLYLRTIKFRAVLFKSIKISYLPMLLRFPRFLYVLLKSVKISYRRITAPAARNFISAAIFLARIRSCAARRRDPTAKAQIRLNLKFQARSG
ncbi:hypothetical protein CGRAC_1214 [Campylobacter gracilis]|nr:hypothetical protein CGRAC_1214 [Campylobacter gracilis]